MPNEEISLPVKSQHIGKFGEVVVKNPSGLPKRIQEILLDYCTYQVPDWVIVDGISFYIRDSDKRYITVVDGEEVGWDCDAIIHASYRHRDQVEDLDYFEFIERHETTKWEYKFLVEIKTGGASLDYQNQRKVMEYYSDKDGMQSLYIHVNIDDIPESYLIDRVEFIGWLYCVIVTPNAQLLIQKIWIRYLMEILSQHDRWKRR